MKKLGLVGVISILFSAVLYMLIVYKDVPVDSAMERASG